MRANYFEAWLQLLTLVESACCPLRIGLTNRFRNSFSVPSRSGLTNDAIQWYSIRLFCRGVPVNTHRRRVLIVANTFAIADSEFLSRWPSSHTITSGPGSTSAAFCARLYLPTRVRLPDARMRYLGNESHLTMSHSHESLTCRIPSP